MSPTRLRTISSLLRQIHLSGTISQKFQNNLTRCLGILVQGTHKVNPQSLTLTHEQPFASQYPSAVFMEVSREQYPVKVLMSYTFKCPCHHTCHSFASAGALPRECLGKQKPSAYLCPHANLLFCQPGKEPFPKSLFYYRVVRQFWVPLVGQLCKGETEMKLNKTRFLSGDKMCVRTWGGGKAG